MTKQVQTVTKTDKVLIAAILMNAGIKARCRVIRNGVRVVFDGSWEAVAAALNAEGYRSATAEQFGRFSFDGNQAFVRYAEVA